MENMINLKYIAKKKIKDMKKIFHIVDKRKEVNKARNKEELINKIEGILIRTGQISPVTEKLLDYRIEDDGTVKLLMKRFTSDYSEYKRIMSKSSDKPTVDFDEYCDINTINVWDTINNPLVSEQIKEVINSVNK